MATKDCASCGEVTCTPPVCSECSAEEAGARADRLRRIRVTAADNAQYPYAADMLWLLDELGLLTASEEGLREHWYRDRDRALAAESDRARLAAQVRRVRDLCEDGRFIAVPVSVVAEALDGPAQ